MVEKESRNSYKVSFANQLLFVLNKLNKLDTKLEREYGKNQFLIQSNEIILQDKKQAKILF